MQLWVTVFSGGSHLHRMCWQSCSKGFFVVKWIDCFRAVCVCESVCERVSIYAVNKICLCPQTMADTECSCVCVCKCVMATHKFSTGYWVLWVVMATVETLFTMILFLFLLNKGRRRMQIDSPYQPDCIRWTKREHTFKWEEKLESCLFLPSRRVSHTDIMSKTCTEEPPLFFWGFVCCYYFQISWQTRLKIFWTNLNHITINQNSSICYLDTSLAH